MTRLEKSLEDNNNPNQLWNYPNELNLRQHRRTMDQQMDEPSKHLDRLKEHLSLSLFSLHSEVKTNSEYRSMPNIDDVHEDLPTKIFKDRDRIDER